jgi:hypothetical protein
MLRSVLDRERSLYRTSPKWTLSEAASSINHRRNVRREYHRVFIPLIAFICRRLVVDTEVDFVAR